VNRVENFRKPTANNNSQLSSRSSPSKPKACILPRDAIHKRGHAIMRCLYVCLSVCLPVTFVDCVKTNKHNLQNYFSQSGSQSILVFHTKRHGNIPTETPLTGALNAGGVNKHRDSEPISGFTACCEPFQRQVQYI